MDVWTTLLLIQTVMNSKEIYHCLAVFYPWIALSVRVSNNGRIDRRKRNVLAPGMNQTALNADLKMTWSSKTCRDLEIARVNEICLAKFRQSDRSKWDCFILQSDQTTIYKVELNDLLSPLKQSVMHIQPFLLSQHCCVQALTLDYCLYFPLEKENTVLFIHSIFIHFTFTLMYYICL